MKSFIITSGTADSSYNVSQITDEVLRIEDIDFRCMENAEQHDTHQYELVRDVEQPNPVFRRGKTFIMDIVRTILVESCIL